MLGIGLPAMLFSPPLIMFSSCFQLIFVVMMVLCFQQKLVDLGIFLQIIKKLAIVSNFLKSYYCKNIYISNINRGCSLLIGGWGGKD
jgi:hypothetical protein